MTDDPTVTPCHPPALACQWEGESPNQFSTPRAQLAGDADIYGGTRIGCWDSWWDRERILGSRRDSFFIQECFPAVTPW